MKFNLKCSNEIQAEKCDVSRTWLSFRSVCYQPWRIEYFGESKVGPFEGQFSSPNIPGILKSIPAKAKRHREQDRCLSFDDSAIRTCYCLKAFKATFPFPTIAESFSKSSIFCTPSSTFMKNWSSWETETTSTTTYSKVSQKSWGFVGDRKKNSSHFRYLSKNLSHLLKGLVISQFA